MSPGSKQYVGRFAPSPTGKLHFGSLVAALASFLDARSAQGRWLVRMEDLDPPREAPGAAEAILSAIDAHGLHWDGEVEYQSRRTGVYQDVLDGMLARGRVYPCSCSRQRLSQMPNGYDGYCLEHPPASGVPVAYKYNIGRLQLLLDDRVQGGVKETLDGPKDDFILKRKDNFFAYQLAVVVDDWQQGITHIVRGSDLLSSTGRQICLFKELNAELPSYAHIPVVENSLGQKLSKQNHAQALDDGDALANLFEALRFLGQSPKRELLDASIEEIVTWAVGQWQIENVPKQMGYHFFRQSH